MEISPLIKVVKLYDIAMCLTHDFLLPDEKIDNCRQDNVVSNYNHYQ